MTKKNNAADRPSPVDHRPQGVMQRVPWAADFALLLPVHCSRQERVFPAKTAEGACVTPIGALNAQAKGLATAYGCNTSKAFPTGERPASSWPTEGANLHRRVNLSGKPDSRGNDWLWS